ncbi:DoxX family protein [Naasia lichenicola]|uniref:DoxX family protein n=1 Tax=Naasia lichenicola TaxID=2565933 RepID=A0A4S4FNJ1_9MICO|nr:DoxX family protein [Naasia lichenicola]THG31814.1 DoxX family protein [Naasia lichenicola]
MKFGILIVRLVVGGVFIGHGLQKLKGYFDGPGLDGVEGMMKALEMHPPRRNAQAVALTETLGGAAIALGAATPAAAAGLIATMIVAIRKVHWSKGVWNSNGGFEYNAVLIAAVAAIAGSGPGKISFDALLGKSRWGALGGILAVVGGALGSIAAVELGRRSAPAASASSPSAPTESE